MSTDYAPNSKANKVLTEEHQLLLGAHGRFYITGLFVRLSRLFMDSYCKVEAITGRGN
jgi:hypothetical protein